VSEDDQHQGTGTRHLQRLNQLSDDPLPTLHQSRDKRINPAQTVGAVGNSIVGNLARKAVFVSREKQR
jgi:hypothetical protein